jgi:hypothetical protein
MQRERGELVDPHRLRIDRLDFGRRRLRPAEQSVERFE